MMVIFNSNTMSRSFRKMLAMAIFIGSFVSCTKESSSVPSPKIMTITTITAGVDSECIDTKAQYDPSERVFSWLEGDAINVFFGSSVSSKFVCQNSGKIAQFKGSIDVVTGGGEGLDENTSLWGVYPYSPDTVCDGNAITYTLPSVQPAEAGTIPSGLNPLLARSGNFLLSFYNVCGTLRFTVSNPDITKVTIRGNNREIVAGRVKITKDATPEVSEVLDGETELTMIAPNGGCFEVGPDYYFVLYPNDFTQGLTLTFYKEGYKATYEQKAYTLQRNGSARLRDKDKGLTFEPYTVDAWGEGEKIEGEI